MAIEIRSPVPPSPAGPVGETPTASPGRSAAAQDYHINTRLLVWTLLVGVVAAPVMYFWYKYQHELHASALLDRGRMLRDKEQWPEAAAAFHQFVRLHPEDPEALALRAQTFDKLALDARTKLQAALYYGEALGAPANRDRHDLQFRQAELLYESRLRYKDSLEAVDKLRKQLGSQSTGQSAADTKLRRDVDRLYAAACRENIGTEVRNASDEKISVTSAYVVSIFEDALRTYPGDVVLSVGLAKLLDKNSENLPSKQREDVLQQADRVIDEMIARNPGDPEVLQVGERKALLAIDRSLKEIDERMDQNPGDRQALEESRAAFLKRREAILERRAALLERYRYQNSHADANHYGQLQENRQDNRNEDLAELLKSDPNDPDTWPDDPDVLIVAASAYSAKAAADEKQAGLESDPATAAKLRSSAAEHDATARRYETRVIEVAPQYRGGYLRTAALLANRNNLNAAIDTLNRALLKFGDDNLELNLELLPLLVRAGKVDAARKSISRIEPVFKLRAPDLLARYRNSFQEDIDWAKARVQDLEGDTEDALKELERLASTVSERDSPRETQQEREKRNLVLAFAYSQLGRHADSGATYDKLISLNPRSQEYCLRAAVEWGKSGNVVQKYKRLDNAPNVRAAWLAYAQYCADQQLGKTVAKERDWQEFEEVVKKASDRFGKDGAFVALEAIAALARNDRKAALNLLKTLEPDPKPDDARYLQRAWLVLADSALERQLGEPDAKMRKWEEFNEVIKQARRQLGKSAAVLLPEASAALARNDRSAALSLLETFGSIAKIEVAQLPRLASLWQKVGNRAGADAARERFLESGGDSVQWALAEFKLLMQQGEAAKAIAVLAQVREQVPAADRSAFYRRLVELEIDAGAIQSARQHLHELRAAKSRDTWVYETVADLAIVAGDFAELEACEREVKIVEGDAGTLWRYCRAIRLLEPTSSKRNGQAEASRLLEQIDEALPNWPLSKVLRGCLAERSARDEDDKTQQEKTFDQAIEDFELALQSGARNLTALQRLVATLYRQKRYDDASAYIQQRGQFAWLSDEFAAQAVQAHLQVGRIGEALRIARAAAELRPADAASQLLYAQCLSFDNKNREAETIFRKATRIAPADIRTWISLVRFYGRQRRQADARQALDELVAHVELTPFKREVVLAQALDLIGDRPGAERHYLLAVADSKADSNLLEEVGRFFLPSDPDRAFEFFQSALKLDAKSTEVLRQIALLCGLRGNDPELGRAIELLGQGDAAALGDDRRLEAARLLRRGGEARCRQAVELLSGIVKPPEQPLPADRLLLARAYIDLADIDSAQEQYEVLLKSREETLFQVLFVRFLNRYDRLAVADQWLSRLEQDGGSDKPEFLDLRIDWLRRSRRAAEIEPLLDAFLESQMKLAKNDSQQTALIRNAADLFTDLKLYDAAEKKHREIVRRNPAGYKPLALWLAERGRVDEALALCLEKSPGPDANSASVETCRLIALVCGLRGIDAEPGRAKELLGQGEAVAGGDDRRMQAALLLLRGEDERCRQAVELLSGQVKSLEQPVLGDRLLLAKAYADLSDVDSAQEQFELLLKSREESAFQFPFVRFLNRHNRLVAAERWLARLEQDGGSDKPEVLELRVDWLRRSQRVAEIEPLVDRFLARQMKLTNDDGQQAALLRSTADLLTGVKLYDAAEKMHREIVRRNPAAYRSLAVWLAERGRVDEALTVGLENSSGPDATLAATCLVDVLLAATRLPSAVSFDPVAAERAIDAFSNAGRPTAEFLLQLAVLRSVQGRNAEAVAVYERMLKEDPDNPIILNNLAIVLADIADRGDEALRCIDKVVAAYPGSFEVLDSQGLVLAGIGRFDEARQIFERLCGAAPNTARFHLHLAMALKQLGDLTGSREHAKIAIDNQVDTELLAPSERRFVNEAKLELSQTVP